MRLLVLTRRARNLIVFMSVVAMVATAFVFRLNQVSLTASAAGASQYSSGESPFVLAATADGHARIKLQTPYELASDASARGAGRALGLAKDDFDRDGFPDLVSAFASSDGRGYLTIQRGNPESFAPTLPENIENTNKSRFGTTFLAETRTIDLPSAPDFVVTGDFDRDQSLDILTARRGGTELTLVRGNGRGGFEGTDIIALPGELTALAAGEFDQPDLAADAVVSVFGNDGAQVLVFSGLGGIRGKARTFASDEPAGSLSVARVDADAWGDIVILGEAGGLSVLHGREAGKSEAGRLERIPLGIAARAAAVGEFVWDRSGLAEIAVLGDDGIVRFMSQGVLDTRPFTPEEIRAQRLETAKARAAGGKSIGRIPQNVWDDAKPAVWTQNRELAVIDAANVAAATTSLRKVLTTARLSGQAAEDLVVADSAAGMIRIFAVDAPEAVNGVVESFDGARQELALPVSDAPVGIISMRTSLFVREGLVVLKNGATTANIIPSAPSATFTVTKTADTNDGLCNADCSLREAHVAANSAAGADLVSVPAGNYTLTLSGNDDSAAIGDLDINQDTTLSGAGSASTILLGGSTISNGIDKLIGVNPVCSSVVSGTFNGITGRFGRNTRPVGDFSETGGGLDFCGFGAGAMTITNSVFDQNSTVNSYGGGINLDSVSGGNGAVQLTGVTVTGNTASTGQGGGINIYGDALVVTITGATVTGNTATATGGAAPTATGGGIHSRLTNGGSVSITTSTISNNTANSYGGGIAHMPPGTGTSSFSLTSSTISGNTSLGSGTGSVAMGGGVYVDNGSSGTVTLNKLTLTGNVSTLAPSGGTSRGGGGIGFGTVDGAVTLSFSRIANNIATSGTGALRDLNAGAVTATNNWWGCSTGPTAAPCDTAIVQGGSAGSMTSTPFLRFTNTASSTSIVTGQTSTLTASALTNSAGTAIAASNLDVLIGQTVTWGSPTLGTLSAQQTTVQPAGTATATFTGTTVGSTGGATATVDNGGVATNPAITVGKANTTTTITADTPDPSGVGQAVTVSYSVAVTAPGGGTPTGNVIVGDGVNSCVGTVAAGSCAVSLSTAGNRTLTATYVGDTNYNASPASAGVPHAVGTVTWTGATSTAFATGTNWNTGQAPGAGDTVIIPTGVTNQPAISGATSLSNLSVAAGRTLTVNSTLTVSGTLTNNGTIQGTGTIVNNFSNAGSVAPGLSPGILTVSGTYANTGSLDIELGGTAGPGVNPNGHDQLVVSGAATLGGTLNVTLTNGYTPVNGDTFVIVDAASSSGTFATVNLPTLPAGQFNVAYNNAAGTVTLTAVIPSAAGVSISGRVMAPNSGAISRARVTVTDLSGQSRTVTTNTFGYYTIDGLSAGQTYTITVGAKSYNFAPRVVDVSDNVTDLDFIAEP